MPFDTAQPSHLPVLHTYRLAFTGRTADYWRIWTVNLTLNVLTLGLYSPWAKLRKMRWFASHTEMLGDRFDFQADPLRLLLGRLVALVLFVLYGHVFQFSKWAGVSFAVAMLVISPVLFASAQRFKLRASSWRGIQFDFHVSTKACYAGCTPILMIWLVPWAVLHTVPLGGWTWAVFLLPWLALPWAHARRKAMQHRRSSFLGRSFQFDTVTESFYFNYLFLIGLALGVALVLGVAVSLLKGWAGIGNNVHILIGMVLVALVFYMLTWPLFAARQQKLVWDNTRWGDVQFVCDIRTKDALRLVIRHGPLVLLSAGLWWPVAAVAWARLRVQAIALTSERDLEEVVQRPLLGEPPASNSKTATGDAAADMFGLDLGW